MTVNHWVRIGAMGAMGRYAAADSRNYPRGSRVICRTLRGLEVGEVLSTDESGGSSEGPLLRRVTVEDDLLLARLEKHRDEAFEACTNLLEERKIDAALIDVESLFDGGSIFFYFLGEITPEIDALTAELAETYEAKVQVRKFQELLTEGCGPDCGTEAAGGCGTSGGCSTCAVAAACKK